MTWLWIAVKVAVLSALTVPVAVSGTYVAAQLFLPLPVNLPEQRAEVTKGISHVLDIDGNEIALFREFDQKIPVKPEDIPLQLKQAVIASEDQNFYKHSGVDFRGTARALVANLRGRSLSQGGSTITQQYVRNTSEGITFERSLFRKVKEVLAASQVDRGLEKEEILFRYLNTIYFGEGANGVGAASETYFQKPVNQLTLSESAMLAGLIPAPSLYEPRGNPDAADQRRRVVLRVMLEQGYIDQAAHDEAAAQTVWPVVRGKPPGPATLIQPPVTEFRKYPYFVDYVEKYLRARGFDPDRAGLRIQTSLDPAAQRAAERAAADALKGTAHPVELAIASVEPATGFVKAMVGGRDFYTGPSANVNLALGGCPRKPADLSKVKTRATCWDDPTTVVSGGGPGRQTGSSWKPFTLAAAFEKGIVPSKVYPAPATYRIPNCRVTKASRCTISNNEGRGGGAQSLRTATAQSTNTVYAALEADVGPERGIEIAKKLGIGSAFYYPTDHGVAGLTLGVLDTAPLEMAAAYAVFANRGERHAATPIVKVVDSAGKTVIDNTKRKPERVLDEIVADNVTDLLRGVIAGGTGGRADIGRPAAGKTGSSQENANAWFVGYTPALSTAVWMGKVTGQGPKDALVRIKGVARVFGGTIPAATWKDYMGQALEGVPVTDFNEPAPIKSIADALSRKERSGFDPGPKRSPTDVGNGGQFEFDLPPPKARQPATTTTSTTTPPGRGPGDGDGGGGGIVFPD
ncbi:MAG TPA: transglycosylase domain-containing protein [Acidimicrobiales bacterium]|nr:transglycosylase domain-containing protein [Acidimicrobiales bacterium]